MTQDQITTALASLRPGAQWVIRGETYADIDWLDKVQAIPTEAEIAAYVPAGQILSQDLMAQFTADDAAKIRAAVESNAQFWLLWSAMQAQRDPMQVTNARFLAGWNALVQVLGQARMTAIATALGVTIA